MITKGKSIAEIMVAEVIKSRILSKSFKLLAKAPTEVGLLMSFIPMLIPGKEIFQLQTHKKMVMKD